MQADDLLLYTSIRYPSLSFLNPKRLKEIQSKDMETRTIGRWAIRDRIDIWNKKNKPGDPDPTRTTRIPVLPSRTFGDDQPFRYLR